MGGGGNYLLEPGDESTRQEKQQQTRLAKYDEIFTGRTWDIVRSVHLPPGQCFVTVFGNRGRHGYIIRDRDSGREMVVGFTLLKLIHDRYLGVSLPRRRVHRSQFMSG